MFREKMNNIRFQNNRRAYILLALASELTRKIVVHKNEGSLGEAYFVVIIPILLHRRRKNNPRDVEWLEESWGVF